MLTPWKKSYDQPGQHIKKQRHHFANKYLNQDLNLVLSDANVGLSDEQTGSKLGKEYIKAVYCHPAYLTYMQSTS